MIAIPHLRTARLALRPWRESDRVPFAEMNADPDVMLHMPSLLSRAESDAMVERIVAHFESRGFGLWAVEVPGVADFVGFIGLLVPSFEAHFTPCVEIGWRLARAHWQKGYATEGARAALVAGFEQAGLAEIVSMTVERNVRSWSVMKRLGLHRSVADDFDHPRLPDGHPLKRHVLYRITRAEWRERSSPV